MILSQPPIKFTYLVVNARFRESDIDCEGRGVVVGLEVGLALGIILDYKIHVCLTLWARGEINRLVDHQNVDNINHAWFNALKVVCN